MAESQTLLIGEWAVDAFDGSIVIQARGLYIVKLDNRAVTVIESLFQFYIRLS